MKEILDFIQNSGFWNSTGGRYIFAFLVFLFIVGVTKVFEILVVKKLRKLTKKTKTNWDDLLIKNIQSVNWLFYIFLAGWLACAFVQIHSKVEKIFFILFLLTLGYYLAKLFLSIWRYFLSALQEKGKIDLTMKNLLFQIGKWILIVIVLLLVLQNLGVQVSTLLAGLGIGGLAVAIALQNILSDLFSYFAIHFDKPFEIGDFIVFGSERGTVEKIGLKSTRIRAITGEELVVSNRELTEKKIHNFKRMTERRITFTFGVIYETPTQKLKKIPEIIKEIFEKIEMTRLERVHLKSFGDFSLDFEVVYYVLSPDYLTYLDIQQKVNLALKERFEKEKIEFAYPAQTIFLKKQS